MNKSFLYIIYASLIMYMFLGLASIYARYMLVVILLAISFCLLSSLKNPSKSVFFSLFSLLALNVIYYLISDKVVAGVETTGFFSNIVLCLGIFFVSFYFSKKNIMTQEQLPIVFFFLFIVTSYRFFIERQEMILSHEGRRMTQNLAYSFVIYLPVLFYYKKKLLSIAFYFLSLFMVVTGAKRGAILVFLIFSIYYFYVEYAHQMKKIKFRYVVLGVIFASVAIMIAYNVYLSNEYLQMRIDNTMEGDSNGREYYFRYIWQKWLSEQNPISFLFGYGFCSSIGMIGNHAHNDWLEILSTAGLLGVIVYSFFYATMIRQNKNLYPSADKKVLTSIIIILFVKSLFSMSYCSVENMSIFLILGYVVGNKRGVGCKTVSQ